jgi:hypothetical protein
LTGLVKLRNILIPASLGEKGTPLEQGWRAAPAALDASKFIEENQSTKKIT